MDNFQQNFNAGASAALHVANYVILMNEYIWILNL